MFLPPQNAIIIQEYIPKTRKLYGRGFLSGQSEIRLYDNIIYIKLKFDTWAIADAEEFEKIRNVRWGLHKKGKTSYVERVKNKNTISLHRTILGLFDSRIYTDHVNMNGLDNRKTNLRTCNAAENQWNVEDRADTGYSKGVNWHKGRQKWQARIQINKKRMHLGYFSTKEEAKEQYIVATKLYQKEFARN